MLTCLTRAEPGSHLTGALCPRIPPSPMMTRCAVANFGNGFDEPLLMILWGGATGAEPCPALCAPRAAARGGVGGECPQRPAPPAQAPHLLLRPEASG
jgi:hypothetical protein